MALAGRTTHLLSNRCRRFGNQRAAQFDLMGTVKDPQGKFEPPC